jgi:hypothetical protein
MESLDSPLLLRIFRNVMCPAGGTEGSIVVAEPIASDDDAGALAPPADEEALHPKHLAALAGVSRCERRQRAFRCSTCERARVSLRADAVAHAAGAFARWWTNTAGAMLWTASSPRLRRR